RQYWLAGHRLRSSNALAPDSDAVAGKRRRRPAHPRPVRCDSAASERLAAMIRLGSSSEDIERAAGMLRRGELVAIPTETVYGLAGDAANPDAIRRIFAAKGRPADHPLI